ncbi:MAG TPA: plastocyanin/azurin family copper-binding protein [Nitrososphaera sp.]|jgi:plastocyanin
MDSHDKEPIILTSPGRMSRGLIIVGITLAIGAAISVTFFDQMFANPPPVTQIKQPTPPPPPPQAGTTTIAILAGSSVQGSPDYGPDAAQVPLGNKIVWDNQDNILHTATSGTSGSDPDSGKAFKTGFLDAGAKSNPIELADVKVGDSFNYFCEVHPYMTSTLTIVAAETGGAPSGPTINILAGSSVQGSPDYDPDPLTVKKGDKISVVNKDNTLHTVTDGAAPGADAGKLFDTGFFEGGQSKTIDTANLNPAEYNYFCQVHPYMTGKLKVE